MKKLQTCLLMCLLVVFFLPVEASAYSANISVPYSRTGTFTTSSDLTSEGYYKDTYVVQGVSGQTIEISLTSSDFDAYIIILDSNSKRVAYNDDGGSGTNALLEYTFPSSGKYSIIATQYRQKTGSYSITVRRPSSSGDIGDDYDEAETIYIDDYRTDIYSSIDYEYDEDYFVFEAPVSGEYRFETRSSGTDVDTCGELRRESGSLMESDDDSGTGSNFKITRNLTAGRTYYLIVYAYEDEIGDYQLRITAPIDEISVPQRDGSYEDVKVSEPLADNGFRASTDGFNSSNSIPYVFPNTPAGSSGEGVCFGMSSVSILNYFNLLPTTGPNLNQFGYNISGISAFGSASFYSMTGSSTYNIGTLPSGFQPANVTINSAQNQRIGQAVGWFQYNQSTIKQYKYASTGGVISTGGSYAGIPEIRYIDEVIDYIDSSNPYVFLAFDIATDIAHAMVPTAIYKIVNQDAYLLQLYDPNYPGQENYAEIYVDSDDVVTGFNVIRMGLTSSTDTSIVHLLNLKPYVQDNM